MIKITRKVKSSAGTSFSSNSRSSISRLASIKNKFSRRSGITALNDKDLESQVRERILARIKYAMEFFHVSILARTPVWSGTTVANYTWSLDRPVIQDQPFNGVDPGKTSRMPLGPEPNRIAAEAAATQSLDNALSSLKSYKKIYLTNSTEYKDGMTYMDLEYGLVPGGKLGSRVPAGGMYRGALKETENAIAELK